MSTPAESWYTARALLCQIDTLADTVGRLRRRTSGDEYAAHLLERATLAVHALDAILRPTAAELVQAGLTPDQALTQIDAEARKLQLTLCEPQR